MKKLFIPVLSLLISCSQQPAKVEKPKVKIGADLAVKCAKIDIMNQLQNPSNTSVEADTVSAINDTLYNIVGHFTTPTEKVLFNCDIALTRDGNSYQMLKINTK